MENYPMSIKKMIRINQRITIAKEKSPDDWFDSVIQGVSLREFHIGMPYKKANPLLLYKGEWVRIIISLKAEKFEFKCLVTGRRFDNIPLFTLAMPTSYIRVQLRQFVRLATMLDLSYSEIIKDKEPEYIKTHTLDISGGGLRFLSKKNYPLNTLLTMKLDLPEFDDFTVTGVVIRSVAVLGVGYHVMVNYTDISVNTQDLLIRYILSKTCRGNVLA
jgi:c-di-GMP-binding flagellar brake protein YcgR